MILLPVLISIVGLLVDPAPTLVRRAHAHNDYEHPRPLFDALENGFCSVEADIWLTKDGLLVAHTPFGLRKERTLQALYLEPLRKRALARGGTIHRGEKSPFFLLIDIKTDAKATYAELAKVLESYSDLLSVSRNGRFERKAVTVVISGNCHRQAIAAQKVRFAGIDGRPTDLDSDAAVDLIPWISEDWSSRFKWDGTGAMPEEQRKQLREFVTKSHQRDRLVRFWGAPDKPAVLAEQHAAGVDLINTDRLADLRTFLLTREKAPR
jgi:hypothetical protein